MPQKLTFGKHWIQIFFFSSFGRHGGNLITENDFMNKPSFKMQVHEGTTREEMK